MQPGGKVSVSGLRGESRYQSLRVRGDARQRAGTALVLIRGLGVEKLLCRKQKRCWGEASAPSNLCIKKDSEGVKALTELDLHNTINRGFSSICRFRIYSKSLC